MQNSEKIKKLLDELKICSDAEISTYFSLIADLFPLLPKAEQNKYAREFYIWAKENTALQPLKFGYSKFLLALNHFLCDQHEPALHSVALAQKHFEDLNNREGIALCSSLMGGIYRTLGNYELALKMLWEGYGLLKQSGAYSHFLAACTCNMGNIYLEMQNHEEALRMFKNLYEQCEKADDHFWIGYALHGLGKVYLLQNKYPEAKEFLEKALMKAEEEKNYLGISNSITELANYHFHSGNFEEAEQLHKRALAIREEHHFVGGAVTNCIRLGEVYIKQSKLDEALQVLTKGLELAEEIKVKPKIYQAHLLLSEIYESKNEPEKSLFHFKLYHQVREMVEKEDSDRKLKNAHLIFEAEQTQKENIIIKKQKAEIEKKNIELQDTIDDLTRAKIGKKAKGLNK